MNAADIIEKAYLAAIGLSTVAGLMAFMLYADAHRWRYLAQAYRRPWTRAAETRRFQHGVAYGHGPASKSYNGILTIGVHADGVAFALPPPWSLFHKPLFIPFNDILGWKQIWYLNTRSIELDFRRAPQVKIVMPAKQAEWLAEASGGRIELVDRASPNQSRPKVWYVILLAQCAMSVGLGVYWLLLR
ncbi:MAG: hypothetical protein AAGC56_05950 [Pseudomonadota bacterium]